MLIISVEHRITLFKFRIFNAETALAEPARSLSWFPSTSKHHKDWKLIGACHDGGIFEWDPTMVEKYERKYLNESQKYETVAFNASGSFYLIAGSLPRIEIV